LAGAGFGAAAACPEVDWAHAIDEPASSASTANALRMGTP
jgi:hypothetical protein